MAVPEGKMADPVEQLQQTALLLADGFQALLSEVQSLANRERQLKQKLDHALEECRRLNIDQNAPANAIGPTLPSLVAEDSQTLDRLAENYKVKDALEACRNLNINGKLQLRPASKPVAAHIRNGYVADIEEDFTTRDGKKGSLGCPFAGIKSESLMVNDPIAADVTSGPLLGPGSAYAQQNPFRCPIRYLNHHSPEEVTSYFEKHKHELPRSHSVCISRYRQDGTKVRQLDAKYGNLQNMIQSLGATHQQYLSAKDGEENVSAESPPAPPSVGDWAKNIDHKSVRKSTVLEVEERNEVDKSLQTPPQFGESLREVRLGESPSRPWGISVPAQQTAASAISEKDIEPLSLHGEQSGREEGQANQVESVVKECPFGHGAKMQNPPPKDLRQGQNSSVEVPKQEAPSPSPMAFNGPIFHGPVFFGYSPDQVAAMMRSGAFGPQQT